MHTTSVHRLLAFLPAKKMHPKEEHEPSKSKLVTELADFPASAG
jgi:hypothetical protein